MSATIDYKSAGVDIEAGNEAVRRIKSHVASTHSSAVLTGLGSFGTLFSLREALAGMSDPVMVQSTDGVGTKTKVTVMAGRYEDLGRDLVAAVAGDIAVMGATPLTFLDYLGLHKTDPAIVEQLVSGMSAACARRASRWSAARRRRCPRSMRKASSTSSASSPASWTASKLITGANIVDWRRAVRREFQRAAYQWLVAGAQAPLRDWQVQDRCEAGGAGRQLHSPTCCWSLMRTTLRRSAACWTAGIPVKGMAHITGGGLVENVPRILPEGLGAVIDRATWTPQPIFEMMQQARQHRQTWRCTAPSTWVWAW